MQEIANPHKQKITAILKLKQTKQNKQTNKQEENTNTGTDRDK